ncbi:hypothetical protein GCM10025771_08050 [Niveibacterium umoris]|uniref:Uncharacterized protein n=1 Tax=Niveibacterium umoris TaxID=1193620 RepID=A0A840BQ40_9RHOO|nr:hypothetical protein [Niveibacterium umoris]MBB4013648.1 hypothetical protein [Niveibacterium umoris]
MAHVARDDILGDCARRCFDANVEAARRITADVVAQLEGALDEPDRMFSSLRQEYGRLSLYGPTPDGDRTVLEPSDYERCAERLESAAAWLSDLPDATQRWLRNWASEALEQVERLRHEGREAYCQPLPASALRLRRNIDVTLFVDDAPEVCMRLQERLRERAGRGAQFVFVRVRPYAEVSRKERKALLSRDTLSEILGAWVA